VVLDEGHIIKNSDTIIAQKVRLFHSQQKIILTGTPLQNNLVELWALLNYLAPETFVSSEKFDDAFNLTLGKVNDSDLKAANFMLKRFMLRRLKDEVEKMMPKKVSTA
jgi:SWI/SNF-related matrix-associated actin-dependent regulator of chromatin subfamily A member 5